MTGIDSIIVAERENFAVYRIHQLLKIPARQIRSSDRAFEQTIADENHFFTLFRQNDMPARVSRAMPDFETQISDFVDFAVLPVSGKFGRRFIFKPEDFQLMAGDAQKQRLL